LFDALSPFIVLNLPIKHGSLSESSFKLPIKTHGWGVNGYIGEGPKCLASDINEKANDKKIKTNKKKRLEVVNSPFLS
jgi:hypothetical protein